MVEEHHSRNSTVGVGTVAAVDEEQQEEMQQAKQTLAAFLKKLTHGDLLCLATRNGLFEAEGRQAISHFIINVKNAFIHQTIAVENGYWASHFRPKLEDDFLVKMITPDTETNVLGLPSEMIVPESIQRRGSKKNPTRDEPIVKVLLQPGTYVVALEGVSLVIDRASIPGLDVKSDSPITEHLLIPFPSARIDSLFFASSPPPPPHLSSNGHAHPSEDTTTEEDERPPRLERSSGQQISSKKGETVEVKEEDTADETFDSPEQHKEEESNGQQMVAKTEMPSLDMEHENKLHALAIIANQFAPMVNGVNGEKKEDAAEESAPSSCSRKSRASSSSKREQWKDWVEEPRESKRVSIPTRKRQLTDELETGKNGQTKRSKERSGSASNSSSSTPPPTLEREEPMAEPIIVKLKRARSGSNKSILSSLKEIKEEHGYASPSHFTSTPHHPLISIKPPPRSTPNHVIRFTKHHRKAEDGQSTPAGPSTSSMTYSSMLHNGIASIIGVKPLPKELTARKTPKKEQNLDVNEENSGKKDNSLLRTRIQAPRAAVIKAQKAAKKRLRMLDDSEDGGDEESGDDGDERARSSDEEQEQQEVYDESTMAATISEDHEAEPKSPEDRGEFKIYTIIKDESDEEKRKQDEQILVRIAKEEAEAREAKKKLEEKLARRDELRTERAEAAAQAEASGETPPEETKDEGPKSAPAFSQRDDPFFVAMMQGGQKKQGPFLKRSLASIYQQSRDFYHSLTKPEACLEWHPRPRVGPDVDGYVHQVSGYPVKVANGAEMAAFQLFDLHNHREFRLGEIVWAKFQREYWPGYIKAFIPAEAFKEYRGDAVMIQWICEEPQYNYVCYADVFHFDLYFSIMYLPAKSDKTYTINVAKALAMDGRPGFWEEHITKPIFDEMARIGGNISTVPIEHLKRIQENAKTRNPTTAQVNATLATIQQKEINHFQYHYKAFYKGRNTNRFVPKKDNCTAMLCLESSTAPEEDDIKIVPRKTSIYKVYKDENKKWHYNVKPEYSTIPTFAEEQVEVHVTDRKTKEYDIYHLYNGASAAPIVETLYETKPVPLGVHGGIVFDAAAKARLAAYLKERKREEAAMSGEPLPEDSEVPSAAQADSAEFAAALCNLSAVTSHEVLHLMDVPQQIIDPASKENNEAWIANTAKCAEHIRLEFEVKEKKIKEYNEKFEEKKRQEEERKAEAQREKEEKAAARSLRHGGVIDAVGIVKVKKPRLSKASEDGEKPGSSREKVKKPRLSEGSDKPNASPRGPKKKVTPPV